MRDFCTFLVGDRMLGVDMAHLREVIEPVASTPVPLSPPEVRGVINLRGELMPILSLDTWLGLPTSDAQIARRPWIAILDVKPYTFGILVDTVGTARAEDAELEAPPAGEGTRYEAFLPAQNLSLLRLPSFIRKLESGFDKAAYQTES